VVDAESGWSLVSINGALTGYIPSGSVRSMTVSDFLPQKKR
jgi:hypothetical protein